MKMGVELLRRAPKVTLHDHLDGGLRIETMIDIADQIGYQIPTDSRVFATAAQPRHVGNLERYLAGFGHTLAVMQRAEDLFRVAHEAVEDLAADGVVYAELRWAPEQHQRAGLSLSEAVTAVATGIASGCAASALAGSPIVVYQVLTARRESQHSLEIAQLAFAERGRGVVGFDIAGAELGFPAKRHIDAFNYLDQRDFPVTVHAGEAFGLDSIRQAVDVCHTRRIGHGVRIVDDIELSDGEVRLGPLAQRLRDESICFEMCPTSNLDTGAIGLNATINDHPFDLLYRLGFNVTVNCDNRLMSHTTMSHELYMLSDAFGYSLSDIEQFAVNAMESAFCAREEHKQILAEVVRPGFAALSN